MKYILNESNAKFILNEADDDKSNYSKQKSKRGANTDYSTKQTSQQQPKKEVRTTVDAEAERQRAEEEAARKKEEDEAEAQKKEIDSWKTKKDWKKILSEVSGDAKKSEAVWREYYSTEWGKNAYKVQKLGFAFQKDLLDNGFDGNSNPVVKFVGNNIDKIEFSTIIFSVVLNAFRDTEQLTEKDILGVGKAEKENIIFNNNFYKLASNDAKKLLNIQDKIIHKTIELTNLYAKKNFIENGQLNLVEFLVAIMYEGGDPTKATKTMPKQRTFKSESDVVSLFKTCTGQSISIKEQPKNLSTAQLVDDIDNVKTLYERTAAILLSAKLTADKSKEIDNKYRDKEFFKQAKTIISQATSTSLEEVTKIKNLLNKFAPADDSTIDTFLEALSKKYDKFTGTATP